MEAEDLERLSSALLRIHTVVKEAGGTADHKPWNGPPAQGAHWGYVSWLLHLQVPVPEDHQLSLSHQRHWLSSTTSTRKDTSLLAFGTDSTTMVNSLLGCLEAKICDVG
jgi:hypothetical protein